MSDPHETPGRARRSVAGSAESARNSGPSTCPGDPWQEFLLLIVGGIFVVELLSVIIQVVSFRYTGKRVFLMAPIHHHYEKLGWAEQKIVVRFWIISAILGLLALSTLKLR